MGIFILVLTCIINLLLGLLVLLRDPKKAYSRLFMLVSVLICIWIIANYFTNYQTTDLTVTNFANKLAYIAGFGLVLSELLFTYTFPLKRRVAYFERWLVAITSVIVIGLSMTESVAGVATLDDKGNLVFSVGELLWVFVLGFGVVVTLMTKSLLTIPKETGVVKRRQASLILLAFGSTAVIGIFFNVILPAITGDWSVTLYTPLATILLVGVIAYTIIKHGLFDIRLAVVRGVAYVLSLLSLGILYYAAAFAISQLFFQNHTPIVNPISVILAVGLAFLFQPIKTFFDRLTNSVFYRNNYNTEAFLARFSNELKAAPDLTTLLHTAANTIGETLQAEYALFAIRYDHHHITVGTKGSKPLSIDEIKRLDDLVHDDKSKIVMVDSLVGQKTVRKLITSRRVAIVLPLAYSNFLPSYLLLGERRSRQYERRDLGVLMTIADELIIAIRNALSVQEIKDINATLQQRIEKATQELRTTNVQLQRLDEAKDEFVSMASHQLRTPLTSVKGYISMVLEGDAGKLSSMQKQLLDEAYTSSERMVHLINDFLNVSRLQTGKFTIERRATDLSKVIQREVDSLQTTAKAHNMTLEYRKPSRFPILYVDEAKLSQVVMNFIDNAIYYSPQRSTIKLRLEVVGGEAILTVEDNGIGVPKDEQQHLFSKFFRATNARKQRPDGTGVGLFLAKKVVVAHGGSIVFKSSEDEGSTFGFRLPVKKLSAAPAKKPNKLNK